MTKKKLIFASLLSVYLIALLSITSQRQMISSEGIDEKQYTRENNISIHLEFTFRDAVEESNRF